MRFTMKLYTNGYSSLLAILMLVVFISSTQGQMCKSRRGKAKKAWNKQTKEGKCNPVRIAKPVVIDGYDLVSPNTVMVNHCYPFHGCKMTNCIPTKMVERIIKVEVWTRGMGSTPDCMEYKITEPAGCKCGCGMDMCDKDTQDHDEKMCKCTCKKKIVEDCQSLINMVGSDKKMFYPSKCDCPCTKPLICARGEMFDKNMCKCIPTTQMMGS
ncbi:unnamed protein product [Meganyctiphanes norvegica]|uniref:Uncharacterized protein n=1 Tax=Meganyctiphanes norvegica TaxID=48144 RepID=A0AAV2QTH1_MEGNR